MDLLKFRTWVEVDLDALSHNLQVIKEHLGGGMGICAVVKADAYGPGAVRVARFLKDDCAFLAVAMAEEAYELRNAGIETPVLLLGIPPVSQLRGLIESDVSLTVASLSQAQEIERAAGALGKKAKIHIALDTGMGRIGFLPSMTGQIKEACALMHLQAEGIFTHFACADEPSSPSAFGQQRLFEETLCALKREGVTFPIKHLYNSAAVCTMAHPFDMIRAGILLYGVSPLQEKAPLDVWPVMTMKSRVIQVRTLPAGSTISYGSTYKTDKETVSATVSAGYGDGVPRLLSNRGHVVINGQKAPIVGRVCMDQLIVDVTHIRGGVAPEEPVVLFGRTPEGTVGADEVMASCGGIAYELLCGVNKRVPRVYLKDGAVESVSNILPEFEEL